MSQGPNIQESVFADAGGVHVEKSYVPDEFPVPAIRFKIEAPGEAVSIRLTDEIPESFPMDRVGFHPEYESENWTAYQDHRVEFSRDLAADEEVVTVYGIRTEDPDEIEEFLVPPTLERIDAEGAASNVEEVIGEDSTEPVREIVENEDTSLAGLNEAKADRAAAEADVEAAVAAAEDEAKAEDDTENAADDAPADDVDPLADDPATADVDATATDATAEDSDEPTLDLEDPAETETESGPDDDAVSMTADEATDAAAATTEATPSDPAASTVSAADGVAAQLAAEIRSGEVADEDLETLQKKLDFGVPRSVDARIGRLQAQVSDMASYADALEQFIDEEGTAQEVVESFESELVAVSATVEDLSNQVEHGQTERSRIDADLNALQEEVGTVTDRVASTEGDVSAVDARVEDLSTNLGEVESSVARAEADVSSLTEWVEDHESDLKSLQSDVTAMESTLDSVASRVDELDSRLDAVEASQKDIDQVRSNLDSLESDITAIRAELEDVQQFRKRISSAFGPGETSE